MVVPTLEGRCYLLVSQRFLARKSLRSLPGVLWVWDLGGCGWGCGRCWCEWGGDGSAHRPVRVRLRVRGFQPHTPVWGFTPISLGNLSPRHRWRGWGADFASGSSGSPFGAVRRCGAPRTLSLGLDKPQFQLLAERVSDSLQHRQGVTYVIRIF